MKVKVVYVVLFGVKNDLYDDCELENRVFIGEISVLVNIGCCYVKFFGDYNFIYLFVIFVKVFGFK